MVSSLLGTKTFSWYVPARSTIVCPLLAAFTAAATVRSGCACVPGFASLPWLEETNSEPAGTGYCALPTGSEPRSGLSGGGGGAELDDEGELDGLDEDGAGLLELEEEEEEEEEDEELGAELLLPGALDELLGALDELLGEALVGAELVGAELDDGSGRPCPTRGGVSQPRRLFTVTYVGRVVRVLYTATPTDPGATSRAPVVSTLCTCQFGTWWPRSQARACSATR
jgi:hypothetical protein